MNKPLYVLMILMFAEQALAHSGRRFEITVQNEQLITQGYISSGIDDGGGLVRPYYNVIHDHWSNSLVGTSATANLPGFDLPDPGPLAERSLTLSFVSAAKWAAPPIMPSPDLVPTLTPLDSGESILIEYASTLVSTDTPGRTVAFFDNIPQSGLNDIDLTYSIASQPIDVIYVLQFQLLTSAPGVAASDPVYVLLSPDGDGPAERLHHASLHLERYLGVPEPGAGWLIVTLALASRCWRR